MEHEVMGASPSVTLIFLKSMLLYLVITITFTQYHLAAGCSKPNCYLTVTLT